MNNIRVLPDFGSSMSELNTINLDKISDKISEIRGELDSLKEEIYKSCSVPSDLNSGANKYETLRNSQQLNNRVNTYITSIDDSVANLIIKIAYLRYDLVLNREDIVIKIFSKTATEYEKVLASSEQINNYVKAINDVLDVTSTTLKDSVIIDEMMYLDFIQKKLESIDPEITKLISRAKIEELIKSKATSPTE